MGFLLLDLARDSVFELLAAATDQDGLARRLLDAYQPVNRHPRPAKPDTHRGCLKIRVVPAIILSDWDADLWQPVERRSELDAVQRSRPERLVAVGVVDLDGPRAASPSGACQRRRRRGRDIACLLSH
jgi:hypothetical protein